jgi:hypothetical protein
MDEDDVPAGGEGNLVDASTDQEGTRARAADRAALDRMKATPPPVSGATPPAPAAPASSDTATTPKTEPEKRIKLVSDVPSGTPGAPPAGAPAAAPTAEERLKALEAENAELKAKTAPAAPAAEPEVVEPSQEEVTAQVRADVAKDVECRNLKSEWDTNEKRASEIVAFKDGVPIGGELVDIATRINTLEGLLDPAKRGIDGAPEVDEITKDGWQRQLDKALGQRERLLSEHQRLVTRNEIVDGKHQARVRLIADHVTKHARSRSQEKARETQEAHEQTASENEWNDAFKNAIPQDLSKEDKAWVYSTLLDKANSTLDRGVEIPNFERWMKAEGPALLERIGRKAGADAAAAAREKERTTSRQAPTGPASVATVIASPDNQNLSASERRRAAEKRTSLLARRILAR